MRLCGAETPPFHLLLIMQLLGGWAVLLHNNYIIHSTVIDREADTLNGLSYAWGTLLSLYQCTRSDGFVQAMVTKGLVNMI